MQEANTIRDWKQELLAKDIPEPMVSKSASKNIPSSLKPIVNKFYSKVEAAFVRAGINELPNGYLNRLRFLNWRVWQLRYAVSLDWIANAILEEYAYIRRNRNATTNLGLPVVKVTGRDFQERLVARISKEFPDGENVAARRSQLKVAMLELPETIAEPKDEPFDNFVRRYQQQAVEVRKLNRQAASKFKRPFRGNPF